MNINFKYYSKKVVDKTVGVCPTCLEYIKDDDRVIINLKSGLARHANCAALRPMQEKAITELDNVMKSMKIRGV